MGWKDARPGRWNHWLPGQGPDSDLPAFQQVEPNVASADPMRPMDAQQVSSLLVEEQMVAICDTYGTIQYLSQPMQQALGGLATVGCNLYDVVPAAAWSRVMAAHEALIMGHEDLITNKIDWLGQCATLTARIQPGSGRGHLILTLVPAMTPRSGRDVRLRTPEQRR